MTALHDLPAQDLLAAYRQRTLSPVEVTQAVLAHMERWEPHIRATYLLRPEHALAQARQSEARWQRGEPQGLLDGVPVTIKENIATQGDPHRWAPPPCRWCLPQPMRPPQPACAKRAR